MTKKEVNKCKWSRWTRICLMVMAVIVVCLLVWLAILGFNKTEMVKVLSSGLPALAVVAVVWLVGLWVKRAFAKK
jgi:phosphatidylserine synthase